MILKTYFLLGLPGLLTHANVLKGLLKEMLPDIYIRFEAFEVEIEIIIAEWVFSLFSAVIPLRLQIKFYESFFKEGWNFFYKLCISIILHSQQTLNLLEESGDIYITLKLGKNDNDQDDDEYIELWMTLLEKAQNLKISSE